MPNHRSQKLTPEIAEKILALIRSGGFPLVAAEGAGVPVEIFRDWLKRGEQPAPRQPYLNFAREVRQAAAMCRLVAECNVYKKDPKFWLAHGPGRDRPGYPGWAGETRPLSLEDQATGTAPAMDWSSVCIRLLNALADFPDARAAAAQALQELKVEVPAP
jgi:hypothetical protein